MNDSDMTDDQQEWLRQAERMAHESKSNRLAWLFQVQEQLKDHPRVDSIIQSLRDYMEAHNKSLDSTLKVKHIEEHLEAHAYDSLESLLSMPQDAFSEHLTVDDVAQIALLSILMEPLRSRCQTAAAHEKLWQVFHWLREPKATRRDDAGSPLPPD